MVRAWYRLGEGLFGNSPISPNLPKLNILEVIGPSFRPLIASLTTSRSWVWKSGGQETNRYLRHSVAEASMTQRDTHATHQG
jgi:hypothetical protein